MGEASLLWIDAVGNRVLATRSTSGRSEVRSCIGIFGEFMAAIPRVAQRGDG
jgi:hypothetical protein